MKSKYGPTKITRLIQRLVVVRHADTEPTKEGVRDDRRRLTQLGITQARGLMLSFAGFSLTPDLSFCSPARRAVETEYYVIGHDRPFSTQVPQLYPSPPTTGRDPLGEALKELGTVQYADYRQFTGAQEQLLEIGQVGLEAILDLVARLNPKYPLNCFVFGHGPLLSGLVHALLLAGSRRRRLNKRQDEGLQGLIIREADAVSLRLDEAAPDVGYQFEHHIIQRHMQP